MKRLRSLPDLPLELRFMIKEHIEKYDLLSHVCYYQLCHETHACYAQVEPSFWPDLLRSNGLGRSNYGDDLLGFEHEDCLPIALECGKHAWTCFHPACGVTQLKESRRLMDFAHGDWPDWESRDTIIETDDEDEGSLTPTSVFKHISFNNTFEDIYWSRIEDEGLDSVGIGGVAFLRTAVNADSPAWTPADLLNEHPIAMRTFAVLPPIRTVKMFQIDDLRLRAIVNVTGVTVRDVLTKIGNCLNQKLTMVGMRELLTYVHGAPSRSIFPSTWRHSDMLYATRQLGHFFQVVNWIGLEYDEKDEEHRWFTMKFNYKRLPDRIESHLRQFDPHYTVQLSSRFHANVEVQTDA